MIHQKTPSPFYTFFIKNQLLNRTELSNFEDIRSLYINKHILMISIVFFTTSKSSVVFVSSSIVFKSDFSLGNQT